MWEIRTRRFEEDALRILRGLRFAAVLGFSVAPETGRAMETHRALLREIAPERMREELSRLLCGRWAARGAAESSRMVLGIVLPEIAAHGGL